MHDETLVEVNDLRIHFPITRGVLVQRQVAAVRAVDGISFSIQRGETLGLVGESGCGKSTTGRAILQLYKPTTGSITFENNVISDLKGESLRKMRRKMQMIFQDPYASLNPRMTVGQLIGEPMLVHDLYRGSERTERIQGTASHRRAEPVLCQSLPARILRGAAAACGNCTRAGR